MATSNENPFVFPGMGQANPDLSGNPLMASMEMMRRAWAGLTGPGGLAQSLPVAPPMNLEELDKRIAELKSVEGWLSMNLSMLSSTIQGMEVQRSTISTLRSFVDAMSQAPADAAQGLSPLEVVLGIRRPGQTAGAAGGRAADSGAGAFGAPGGAAKAPGAGAAFGAATPNAGPAAGGSTGSTGGTGSTGSTGATGGTAGGAGAPFPGAEAAQSASQAWWDMLQQQFKQIATATAATMPAGGPAAGPAAPGFSPAGAPAGAPAQPAAKPRTPRKSPAKPAARAGKSPAAKK